MTRLDGIAEKIVMNNFTGEVMIDGIDIYLSKRRFTLFAHLLGGALTDEQLMGVAKIKSQHSLRSHIHSLRGLLSPTGIIVKREYRKGYVLGRV